MRKRCCAVHKDARNMGEEDASKPLRAVVKSRSQQLRSRASSRQVEWLRVDRRAAPRVSIFATRELPIVSGGYCTRKHDRVAAIVPHYVAQQKGRARWEPVTADCGHCCPTPDYLADVCVRSNIETCQARFNSLPVRLLPHQRRPRTLRGSRYFYRIIELAPTDPV
jgi:hypothetical protein